MRIGITGTREGMSTKQQREVSSFLRTLFGAITEFHHGCCVGVDEQAHAMVFGHVHIVAHPPKEHLLSMDEPRLEAECYRVEPPRSYLDRNRDIVDAVDLLIVVPRESHGHAGGTWYTFAYAREQRVPCLMIWP